jgi:hypothetical protein
MIGTNQPHVLGVVVADFTGASAGFSVETDDGVEIVGVVVVGVTIGLGIAAVVDGATIAGAGAGAAIVTTGVGASIACLTNTA